MTPDQFATDFLWVSWDPEVDASSIRCGAFLDCTVPRLKGNNIGMTVWWKWHVGFLLNLYEIWNEQCITLYNAFLATVPCIESLLHVFFVTWFLERWNGNWLQTPPLQEDLFKFWAQSKLFHSEEGNDLAFRMLIHNQSNASKAVVASLLRLENAHDVLSLLAFAKRFASHAWVFHDSDLKCFCFETTFASSILKHIQFRSPVVQTSSKIKERKTSLASWKHEDFNGSIPQGLGQASRKEVIFSWSGALMVFGGCCCVIP